MVKADPTRNYYADLKVAANASESEIRKAFRGLALQYHPDRNPGREADFVVKFQEIQAAHEVLCDQAQRAKYDAERRKHRNLNVPTNTPNTPRTRPPPPPRNAYTTTTPKGSYYHAPPPKPSPQPPRPAPPQQHASYASGADRFTSKNFRAPPTAQRTDTRAKDAQADAQERANVFSAWTKIKQARAEDPRTYDPAAHSKQRAQPEHNQQNNPNGYPFGRTQSTRVPSSRKGFDPGTPGGDEGQARSAYRNYARPAPTPPDSTTPPHHPYPPPPMRNTQTNEAPYAEGLRTRTPYHSSAGGERTSMFEGIGRSSSVRNSPTNGQRPGSAAEAGSYSDTGRRQQRNSYGGQPNKPFPHMYADSTDEESESEVFRNRPKHRGPPPPQSTKPPPPPTWNQYGFRPQPQEGESNGTTKHTPNSFKSRSEENINIKFSPSDWHGQFGGNNDYFTPSMPKGSAARGRASPTRSRPSQRAASERNPQMNHSMGPPPVSPNSHQQPQAQYQSYNIPPPPPGPPPNLSFAPSDAAAQAAKFKPEDWAETFKEPTWVFSDQKETSPRRGTDPTKRPKATRKASVAQDKQSKPQDRPDVAQPQKHNTPMFQDFAGEAMDGDADAMDIDSSTPPGRTPDPPKARSRTAPSSPHREHATRQRNMSNGFATTPFPATETKPPASGLNGMASMTDPLTASRDEGGIGLDDLSTALPFPSQASNTHPTKPNTAQKLKFPTMPSPPPLPQKMDKVFVDFYLSRFETYVKEFAKACKAMRDHLAAREVECEGLDARFCHSRGEGTKGIGFASYKAKMAEDHEVLTTWTVCQEKHLKALGECEEVRNRSSRLYLTSVA
jgi:curved DNA-binding protein CbpA